MNANRVPRPDSDQRQRYTPSPELQLPQSPAVWTAVLPAGTQAEFIKPGPREHLLSSDLNSSGGASDRSYRREGRAGRGGGSLPTAVEEEEIHKEKVTSALHHHILLEAQWFGGSACYQKAVGLNPETVSGRFASHRLLHLVHGLFGLIELNKLIILIILNVLLNCAVVCSRVFTAS